MEDEAFALAGGVDAVDEALLLIFARVFGAVRGEAREVYCGEGGVDFAGCAYH